MNQGHKPEQPESPSGDERPAGEPLLWEELLSQCRKEDETPVSNKVKYVVGFLFDELGEHVALILKARPAWQAGRLNGIGGHIEKNETPLQAMRREFFEETGATVGNWSLFAKQQGCVHCADACEVYFFRAKAPLALLEGIDGFKNNEEEVVVQSVNNAVLSPLQNRRLPNLLWLIPLALCAEEFGLVEYGTAR